MSKMYAKSDFGYHGKHPLYDEIHCHTTSPTNQPSLSQDKDVAPHANGSGERPSIAPYVEVIIYAYRVV